MKKIAKFIGRTLDSASDFTNKHVGMIYTILALVLLANTVSNCSGRAYNAGYKAGVKDQLETILNRK